MEKILNFLKQFKNKIKFSISRTLKKSILQIFKDTKSFKEKKATILLSPGILPLSINLKTLKIEAIHLKNYVDFMLKNFI